MFKNNLPYKNHHMTFYLEKELILPLIDREKLRYGTLPLFYWKT